MQRAIDAVMVLAPGQAAGRQAGDRLVGRAGAADELQRIAPHEAARRVGLVELLAPHDRLRPAVAVHLLVDIAGTPAATGAASGSCRPGPRNSPDHWETGTEAEFSSSRGVPMPLAARITTSRRLEPLHPVRVVVDDAGGHALLVGGDLAHAAARAQLHPGAQRMRPIGDVDARLRALRAARRAMAEIDALARDRHIPSSPRRCRTATSASRACSAPAHSACRSCRAAPAAVGLVRRIRRIARQAGDAHHAVVLGEIRFERPVVDRPVVRHAIKRSARGSRTGACAGNAP